MASDQNTTQPLLSEPPKQVEPTQPSDPLQAQPKPAEQHEPVTEPSEMVSVSLAPQGPAMVAPAPATVAQEPKPKEVVPPANNVAASATSAPAEPTLPVVQVMANYLSFSVSALLEINAADHMVAFG